MARVFLDCHIFGEKWFAPILDELIKCDQVRFVYSDVTKLNGELSKVRQALNFFKIAGNLKCRESRSRREDVDPTAVQAQIDLLENRLEFINCADCDDPHIFAIVYQKPTPYVFSMDARMARCRTNLNKTIDSKYCRFIVVSNSNIYNIHKYKILS